jgi:hypothetical protein
VTTMKDAVITMKDMDPVDYVNTFIAVAEDTSATVSEAPPCAPESPSIAARTFS